MKSHLNLFLHGKENLGDALNLVEGSLTTLSKAEQGESTHYSKPKPQTSVKVCVYECMRTALGLDPFTLHHSWLLDSSKSRFTRQDSKSSNRKELT